MQRKKYPDEFLFNEEIAELIATVNEEIGLKGRNYEMLQLSGTMTLSYKPFNEL